MDGIPLNTTGVDQAKSGVLDPAKLRQLGRNGDADGAAHEMEKLFATMLVGELRKALPEGFFGSGPGADTFNGWFDEQLGASLASRSSLGLAGQIKESMVAERAAKLRQRFDKWFYVISDTSFKQIHKDRPELFKALPPPAAEG